MKKFLLLLLMIIPLASFSQEARKLLTGQVIADSIEVGNITVLNKSSNIKAITNDEGLFTLYARPKDTLYFSSITFRPAMLILNQQHFMEKRLFIQLDANVTVLDEVIITPLTGDLAKDSERVRTIRMTSGLDSEELIKTDFPRPTTPVNTAMPQMESRLQGVDFVKVYDLIFKSKKKTDLTEQYLKGRTFTDLVQEKYTHYFFTETLKIPHEEIGLFLNYCDNGNETAALLAPNKEFELTEYLVNKSVEYRNREK